MHPFHRLPDAAIAASWALLLGIVGVDAVASTGDIFAPPHGMRALAVTFVICVTVTRVADRAVTRVSAMLHQQRQQMDAAREEMRALIAIGEEIGEHRATLHAAQFHNHRPHRPQATYSRDTGWVS